MKTDKIQELIAPVVAGLGYQLWGIEYLPQGKYSLLRIFIDSANGINLDDCVAVSRQVSAVLDVEDPISGEYNLEVSSPGMDRPLFTEEQYQQSIGETIQLRMRIAVDGQRNFKGQLEAINDGTVILLVDQQPLQVSFIDIEKANVIGSL